MVEVTERSIHTAKEVAEYLSLSLRTTQLWLKDGTLPGFKLRNRWFIYGKDLLSLNREEAPARGAELHLD